MSLPAESGTGHDTARTLTREQAKEAGYEGYAEHLSSIPCPRLENERVYCATCQGVFSDLLVPADPVVSPADTIRLPLNAVLTFDRMQPAWEAAEQALTALDALLAERERDRAALEQAESLVTMHQGHVESLVADAIHLNAERERNRQHIARLEVVKRLATKVVAQPWHAIRGNDMIDLRSALADVSIARAVLAGEDE